MGLYAKTLHLAVGHGASDFLDPPLVPKQKPFPQTAPIIGARFVMAPRQLWAQTKRGAQTISFIERGFERLGFGHRTAGRGGFRQLTSSKESGELYALVILLVFRMPWLGGLMVLLSSPRFLDCLFFLLY